MKILISLFIFILSASSQADIKWTAVTGYSQIQNFNINNNEGVLIFGGVAGTATHHTSEGVAAGACNTIGNTSLCNSCGLTLTPCNDNRIYPELLLVFTFSSTTVKTGTPKLTFRGTSDTQDTEITPAIPAVPTTIENTVVSLSVRWSDICTAIGEDDAGASTCDLENASGIFKLGMDGDGGDLSSAEDDSLQITITVSNGGSSFTSTTPTTCTAGMCDFTLFPGDEKAFIENVRFGSAPVRSLRKVHFYCQSETEGGFDAISGRDRTASISLSNGAIEKDFISNLPNGETYSCFGASEDDTGNIGLFMTDRTTCNAAPAIPPLTSCRQVRPSEVGGLFKDNCFIATAAYGSMMEPQVRTLRAFRDTYLMNNTLGKAFVRSYYKYSPAIADWISISENRRAITRFALAPVVFSVGAFMYSPQLCLMGFLVFAFFIMFSVYKKSLQLVLRKGRK